MTSRNNNTGLAAIDYDKLAYASDYKVSAEESAAFAKVVVANDMSPLSPDEMVIYYFAVSRMSGLNPLNRPFEILAFDSGQKVLYATKRAGDELRYNHKLTTEIVERETVMDGMLARVTAKVTFPDGRTETADGVVPLVKEEITGWETGQNGKRYPVKSGNMVPLPPVEYANALMKAETKAKRRATLSAVGLGMLDESETESIPRSSHATVDISTGEIKTTPRNPAQLPSANNAAAAMAALHAVARDNEISHDDLHTIAVKAWNYTGLKDAKAGELANLAEKIRANPQGARNWVAELRQDDDVVEGNAAVVEDDQPDDPEVRGAQRDVWEIAVESYGWTSAQLESVCQKVVGAGYRQATAEQLNKLYADLVSADEEARSEYLKAA